MEKLGKMMSPLWTWNKLTLIPIFFVCGVAVCSGDVISSPPPIVISTLAIDQMLGLGEPLKISYSLKANIENLRDIKIHLEVGRIYEVSEKGPVRYDVVMVNAPNQQMRTDSLQRLKKGDACTDTFTILIPNVNISALKKPEANLNLVPIAAAWATFVAPDGKIGYDCLWLDPQGEAVPGTVDLKRNNFMASWWRDSGEKPDEKNLYLHYWGPQDGDHPTDAVYIRQYEYIREALGFPESYQSKMLCRHLYSDFAEPTRKLEDVSLSDVVSRLNRGINQIASKEKISKDKAAQKFLDTNAFPQPPPIQLRERGLIVNMTWRSIYWIGQHGYIFIPLFLCWLAVIVFKNISGSDLNWIRLFFMTLLGWLAFYLVGFIGLIIVSNGFLYENQVFWSIIFFFIVYITVVIPPTKYISRLSFLKISILSAILWIFQFYFEWWLLKFYSYR